MRLRRRAVQGAYRHQSGGGADGRPPARDPRGAALRGPGPRGAQRARPRGVGPDDGYAGGGHTARLRLGPAGGRGRGVPRLAGLARDAHRDRLGVGLGKTARPDPRAGRAACISRARPQRALSRSVRDLRRVGRLPRQAEQPPHAGAGARPTPRRGRLAVASTFRTFEEAYLHHLDDVTRRPLFVNAPRGHASRELLGVSFTLTEPRERLVTVPARRTNVVFNFAEALWYLAGRDDVAYPACYAPSIAAYSADGLTLSGTAYGPRIFRYGSGEIDQWRSVVDTLA